MMFGNILFLVLIGVVVYMMMKGGGCCGGHDLHRGHKENGDHEKSGNQNNASHAHHHMETDSYKDMQETDPVCGMEVNDDKIESSYLGKTFHFCSEQCKKVFNLNPNKYAGA